MSQKSLPSKLLNTTISIYRESLLKTDVGDFDKIQETLIYSDIPATVQPKESEIEYEIEGVAHYQTHVCYMNTILNGVNLSITVNDVAKDSETGMKYRIISCHEYTPSNVAINQTHHYKLLLEKILTSADVKLSSASVESRLYIAGIEPPMN